MRPPLRGHQNRAARDGYPAYDDYEDASVANKYQEAAGKLEALRDNLPEQAMKAYHALQLALQPHSRPNGSRPHFEKDFNESLCALFPHARNITARQIGSLNQWEVSIDNGPRMLCSVRLELLTENSEFQKELRDKAKVVKDTLLDDQCKWQRALQPGSHFSFDKLAQFEKECAERYSNDWDERGGRKWVERDKVCRICQKSTDEDQLAGQHMCVVLGSFQCTYCGSDWTSHNARLKPDGRTIMGQQCMQCRAPGSCCNWRIVSRSDRMTQDRDRGGKGGREGGGGNRRGTHQSELCEACREFGNCMGMFYDPFVLTTALSLVSGNHVQWRCFSDSMPELLIADMGPSYNKMQICLQPHVYVAPSGSSGGWDSNSDPGQNLWSQDSDYHRRDQQRYGANGGVQNPYEREEARTRDARRDRQQNAAPPAQRGAAGVKDTKAYNAFLNKVDSRKQGKSSSAASGAGSSSMAPPVHRDTAPGNWQSQSSLAQGYESVGGDPEVYDQGSYARSVAASSHQFGFPAQGSADMYAQGFASGPSSLSGPADYVEQSAAPWEGPGTGQQFFKKSNKIPVESTGETSMDQTGLPPEQCPTPLLDALQPLRRAQLLQIVLRVVKTEGGSEADKFKKAEEFLQMCAGDYNQTYEYVKKVAEEGGAGGLAGLQ